MENKDKENVIIVDEIIHGVLYDIPTLGVIGLPFIAVISVKNWSGFNRLMNENLTEVEVREIVNKLVTDAFGYYKVVAPLYYLAHKKNLKEAKAELEEAYTELFWNKMKTN